MSAIPDDPAHADAGDILPWTIVQAGDALARVFTGELAKIGLKPHLFGILATLSSESGLSSAELARRVLVTPQSMGDLLRRLAAQGLVDYTPPRRGHRMQVALTPAGHELLGRAWPLVVTMAEPAALGLTADEAAQLNRLLHRVLAATKG